MNNHNNRSSSRRNSTNRNHQGRSSNFRQRSNNNSNINRIQSGMGKFHPEKRNPFPRHNQRQSSTETPISNLNEEKLFRRLEHLQESHLIARRKYFEFYYSSDQELKIRNEKKFYQTLEELRQFERELTDQQRKIVSKINQEFPLDTSYSQQNQLPLSGEKPPQSYQIADPHLLETQKNLQFSNDTEEGEGSIQDYLKYKGTNYSN